VGRLFPIKNHALFLDAAALVSKQDPRAWFVVVGDGVLRPGLENQAVRLGIKDRVIFTGWRRDLPRICADLDLLVVSSDNEGTPVSAIEAMAAGCPVVATKVGGLPDLVEDRRTGLLVAPRNAEALSAAVLELLLNPAMARELAKDAQRSVRQRFEIGRLLGDLHRLYDEILTAKAISVPAGAPAELKG
jgi:glycosyltransferase involved in cell wall biosynthesis